MSKNTIYVNKKTDEALSAVAKARGVTKSSIINNLVDQLALGREDVKPIVLLVPAELLQGNDEQLHAWLAARAAGIHRHFYPNNNNQDGINS